MYRAGLRGNGVPVRYAVPSRANNVPQQGSEAKLGDIIVAMMRRMERLEGSFATLVQELRKSDADARDGLAAYARQSEEGFYRMNADLAHLAASIGLRRAPLIDEPDQWSTGTRVYAGSECAIDNEIVGSDAEASDGEGYDYPYDTDHASPTPSECAEIAMDNRVRMEAAPAADRSVAMNDVAVETVDQSGHQIAVEVVEELVEAAGRKAQVGPNMDVQGHVVVSAAGSDRAVTLQIDASPSVAV